MQNWFHVNILGKIRYCLFKLFQNLRRRAVLITGGKVDGSVVGKLHCLALLWAGNGCVWGRQRLCCVIVSGLACA